MLIKKLFVFRLWSAIATVFLLAPPGVHAAHFGMIEDGWKEKITQSISKIANLEFGDGLEIIGEYIKAFPENPGGYFYYAAGVQEKVQKFKNPKDMERFFSYAEKCIELCEINLERNPEDAVSRLFLGGIYGYMGLVETRRRNMIRAFMHGVRTRKHLEQAILERPEIPDTYFGLGMLYYFASRKAMEKGGAQGWFVRKFITHGEDLRKKGIEMTRRSIDAGSLAREYARSSLMLMFFYEEDYTDAKTLAEQISNRYPKDTASPWIAGRVALIEENCGEAKRWFGGIETINDELGRKKADFPDVDAAMKMTKLCAAIELKKWNVAEKLADDIETWLNDEPKIVIEYQDENHLISFWKEEIDRLKKVIKRGRTDFRSVEN